MTAAHPQAPYFIFHAPGKGAIARYHLDKDVIDAQLAALRAAGADGISLSLWLRKGAVADGLGDEYLDWDGVGNLAAQPLANLTALLASIKAHGFNFVQIAVEFWGENDFRQWGKNPDGSLLFKEGPANGNWDFLASLPALCEAAGLEYLIDACAEVNGFDGSVSSYYAKWLWTNITCWFDPEGVPCWNFTFSFLPDPQSIAGLPNLFRGLNDSGPINAPVKLNPHLYGANPQIVYDALSTNGLGGHPWFIGEDYSLLPQHTNTAASLRQFIINTKQPIERICPWPVTPDTPQKVDFDAACIPPVFSQPWATYGL